MPRLRTRARGGRYGRHVCLVLVLVLAVWLMASLDRLGAEAEHASVEASLRLIEQDLMARALVHLVRGEHRALGALAGRNPVTSARTRVRVGAGVEPPAGGWGFDPERRELVYRALHPFDDGREVRRFRVVLEYDDLDHDTHFDPAADRFLRIGLRELG